MSRSKPRKVSQPPVSLGGIVEEDLPLPFVHYPPHYGTFLAFSATRDGIPCLCECSRGAIENYIKLREKGAAHSIDPRFLDQIHLPTSLTHVFLQDANSLQNLHFKQGICHRCNLVLPTMRYCYEGYGVRFVQRFGWYIEQAYLRFGILPRSLIYLDEITPEELIQDIILIQSARIELREAMSWFREREQLTMARIFNPSLPETKTDEQEIAFRQSVLREATKRLRQAERQLSKKIENIVREEFGFRKVGEQWINESLVYRIVCNLFPDYEVLRHYRPDWLDGLELDIFVPALRLAIEYQGQQHFHPEKAWGGEKALRELQERDQRKAKICAQKGIHLVAIDYREPLTQAHIQMRIETAMESALPPAATISPNTNQ